MTAFIASLLALTVIGAATVDEAIDLYLSGDLHGSAASLETLIDRGGMSLDEEIRAYHRLGASYFGLGETELAETSFQRLLFLDPYFDLGPWENPELGRILDRVRSESMATVFISGDPHGALVFFEGEYAGSTPYTRDNLIGGQTYTFTVFAEGYTPESITVTPVPGQAQTISYRILPLASSQPAHGPESEGAVSISWLDAILRGDQGSTALDGLEHVQLVQQEAEESISGQEIARDQARFEFPPSGGALETVHDSRARMVFSEVNLERGSALQTDPGTTYSSRTSEEVREVLSSKENMVTFIYNKHLRADPLLAGTVLIEMVIEPSGRVSSVSVLDSSTMNQAFDMELASAVGTWRFGAVDSDEGPLPVTYPFSFSR